MTGCWPAPARRSTCPSRGTRASSAGKTTSALAKLAVDLDLETRGGPDAERQIRLVAALGAYLRARPDALTIFDNVDRPADLGSDRRTGLVPMGLGGHLLFTTRRRSLEGHFACVEVSVLAEEAALVWDNPEDAVYDDL